MNKKQKIVISIGIAVIVLMALFPPYTDVVLRDGDNLKSFCGYSSFFSPPKPSRYRGSRHNYYIDSQRITIQIIVCILTTIGVVLILGNSKEKS
jgi:hypothetical protein